jgi:hypothetical protein
MTITVAAWPKARNFFTRSDTGIVGSSPTLGMDVCVFSVFVLSCESTDPISTRDIKTESESDLLYDWRFTFDQFVLATGPLRPTTNNFIFQLNTRGYSPYVTSSLTKGWVCSLQLLMSLPA